MKNDLYNDIFKGRKVLVTGHTGFKGAWLCLILHQLEAVVHGYALEPSTNPSLFKEAKIDELVTSNIGDIRDYDNLLKVIQTSQPEIIIHMAAQPLVMESYQNPRETYEINVMGTVNLLEAARHVDSVKAIVNVTSDKCYENKEWYWGYRENEAMGGYDPYSSSKGCSELVTSAYRNSYFNPETFKNNTVALASARAGNVIGGGDWAQDRLIPDFIRAISIGEKVIIRRPFAERPWQHVLEPLSGYLALAAKLYTDGAKYAEGWNFGPDDFETKNVEWIITNICNCWGDGVSYDIETNPQNHEARHLKLDSTKAKSELAWFPKWNTHTTLQSIVEWHKAFLRGENIRKITEDQINSYFNS